MLILYFLNILHYNKKILEIVFDDLFLEILLTQFEQTLYQCNVDLVFEERKFVYSSFFHGVVSL